MVSTTGAVFTAVRVAVASKVPTAGLGATILGGLLTGAGDPEPDLLAGTVTVARSLPVWGNTVGSGRGATALSRASAKSRAERKRASGSRPSAFRRTCSMAGLRAGFFWRGGGTAA